MSEFAPTVLTPEQREKLAADTTVGGGNLLRSAIAYNPHPELPFVHTPRPVTDADGQPRTDFSLNQLDELAQSWSVWYLGKGVEKGDRVAVFLDDSFAYHVHFYALAQIGAIAVLINSNATQFIASSLISQTGPVGLYASRSRLEEIGEELANLTTLVWTQAEDELPAPPKAALPESAYWPHAPHDPVTILHSSGTTGKPKPTIHTHESIAAGPKFRLVDHKEPPGGIMMTALPQSHLGCVAYTVYAVLGGTPVVALRDGSGEDLHAAVVKHKPTSVMSFAHGYTEMAAMELAEGDLDSVNVWISIGDALHQAHITKVLEQRSKHLTPSMFLDRLGTTELGWGVLLKARTLETERNDRCAGKPVGVADVQILRRDGSRAEDREIGFLAAKGPAITPGYWNDSATTYSFKLNGYWLTGDMAYRDEHGDHFLVDRAVDAIVTENGTGYSVHMEEVMLLDVPGIEDVAVLAGKADGKVVPVGVVTVSEELEAEKVFALANEALKAAGHLELGLLEIVADEADFPVGVTGKVLKRELREKYASLTDYVKNAGDKKVASSL
ncbi:class I adenylate-forming enzyme family protein [Kitasatospora sp. NPDC002227]|uniref:class I adenylate-forming enzyme family protein n=1 Tax=Kitasatospora sp. NPDC002227 TaxID=3154773 RepID=UPI00332AFC5C